MGDHPIDVLCDIPTHILPCDKIDRLQLMLRGLIADSTSLIVSSIWALSSVSHQGVPIRCVWDNYCGETTTMFSCLDCRKALIAKSKSHSEISYDRDQRLRDSNDDDDDEEPVTGEADDDLNDTRAGIRGQRAEDSRYNLHRGQVLDGLRRSQTQVRGKH